MLVIISLGILRIGNVSDKEPNSIHLFNPKIRYNLCLQSSYELEDL